MTSSHFFFLFLTGNKSNIIDEKKERKIQGVHDDEHMKEITDKKVKKKKKEIKKLF